MRAALIAAAVAIALLGGRIGLLAVTIVLSLVATGELLRLARARGARPAAPVALAGTAALLVLVHLLGERGPRFTPAVIAAVLGLTFAVVLARRRRGQDVTAIASTMLPVLTVGLLASYLVAIRGMPEGFRLTTVLVAMVLGAEALPAVALALRGGRARVGWWQRLVAGVVGVLVVAVIAGAALPETFSWPTAVALGLFIGAAAPVGRLAATMIDSDLAVSVGDGAARARAGVLVRVDGLLLAAPVFFYAFRALSR